MPETSETVIDDIVTPLPTHPQQIDNDACEVNVADNHDVEVTEELQLPQVNSSLAVSLRGLLQVLDGPVGTHTHTHKGSELAFTLTNIILFFGGQLSLYLRS